MPPTKCNGTKEVAQGKVIHEQYTADYSRWSKIRDEKLTNKAIRITVSPSQDMAEGTMTIYNFFIGRCGVFAALSIQPIALTFNPKNFLIRLWRKGERVDCLVGQCKHRYLLGGCLPQSRSCVKRDHQND